MRAIVATTVAAVALVAPGAQASTAVHTATDARPAVVRGAGATVRVSLAAVEIRVTTRASRGLRAVVTERGGRSPRRISVRVGRSKPRTVTLARARARRQRILLSLRPHEGRPRRFQIEVPAVAGGSPPDHSLPPATRTQPPGEPPPAGPLPDPAGGSDDLPPLPSRPLRWPQPALVSPADVYVSASNRALRLDPGRDYVVHMPVTPLSVTGGLTITGGRNVVLVGGQISIPWQGDNPQGQDRRGLLLRGQLGTVHVEGLLIDGPDVSEGINLDEGLGATVQLENVRVEGLHARDEIHFTDTHPDVIQTWNGPDRLLVDYLTGSSDYQGFFLRPQEKGGPPPALFSFSHVNLVGTDTAGNLLWKASEFPIETSDLWVSPNPHKTMNATLWPSPAAWPGVERGAPASGDYVTGEAGVGYASPGFVDGASCRYVSTVGAGPAPRRCD